MPGGRSCSRQHTVAGEQLGPVASQGEGAVHDQHLDRTGRVDRRQLATPDPLEHGPALWGIDPNGPAGPLAKPLEDAGLTVVRLTGPELARACMGYVDELPYHLGDEVLDTATEAVRKRLIGDGAWAFGRKNSSANIAPKVAVAIARHVLLTHGAPVSPPPMSAAGGRSETSDLARMGF